MKTNLKITNVLIIAIVIAGLIMPFITFASAQADQTNWMIVVIRWFFVMFGWVIITIFFLSFARGGGSTL